MDHDALAHIICEVALSGSCRKFFRRTAGDDWEDQVHDGIIYALKRIPLYDANYEPSAWAFLNIRTGALMGRRKALRQGMLVANHPWLPSRFPGPSQVEAKIIAQWYLAHLPGKAATVLQLWAQGYSSTETARIAHMNAQHVCRTLTKFAPSWKAHYPREGIPRTEGFKRKMQQMLLDRHALRRASGESALR